MHTSPLVTLTRCIVGRSRAHTVVTVEKWEDDLTCCVGGGRRGRGVVDRQLSVLVN